MQILTDSMLLYHGSYCEVKVPDLKQCAKYKDFGQGFYLTTSRNQAENFAKLSTRKAKANKTANAEQQFGVISVFQFHYTNILSIKNYPTADADWLHCVVGHRRTNTFPNVIQELKDYDIITGKNANDNTNATITTCMAGTFGKTGTEAADSICISLLLPERLQNQLCFRTEKALQCLVFTESEQIWL